MIKKILCLALCLILVVSMITGCSSGKTTTGTDNTAANSTDSTSDTKTGGKKIVYWSMWESTEPQGIVIQEAINAYEAATGNTVDVQFKGRTGIREGLQPALDAGTQIDLFDEDIDRVNVTWGDYLMNLEDLVKETDYEATANAGLIAACREVGGGTLKSIPYQPNVFAFFYNQDLFDKAGITEVPKTWSEFLDVCEKLKNAGITPITCDDAYIACMMGYHLSRLVGEERTKEIVTQGLWAEEPAVLKMAKDYEELASKGYPNILNLTYGRQVRIQNWHLAKWLCTSTVHGCLMK